jgi:hypothetical protein
MHTNLFWIVFIAVALAQIMHTAIAYCIMRVLKSRHTKKMEALDALYARAVEHAQVGNMEAVEMVALQFKERAGRPMPKFVVVVLEKPDEF